MSYRVTVYRGLATEEPQVIDNLTLEKARSILKDCIDKSYGFQLEKYEFEVLSIYKPLFYGEKKSDGK